ncbi:MAG: LPS assembly protein LptD [Legionella sp.]|nr:LPS assembly protein LptD [Legionella sp.]
MSAISLLSLYLPNVRASEVMMEPVQACVITREIELNDSIRRNIARCLGWQNEPAYSLCQGSYSPIAIQPLATEDEVRILADRVSFYNEGRSVLSGNVEIQQTGRVVNAETAYVYRDAKSNQVTAIELLGEVRYIEPERLIIAKRVTINPQDKSGKAEDVLYRFNSQRPGAVLPAWGQASLIQRFANKDYLLRRATYSTCAPQDNAWHIEAEKITLDNAKSTGVARDAKLYVGKYPLLYTPYLSFPTSKERKSGFLLPVLGSTNVGGFDLALPYYWNIAPNYDATITPHLYTRRGLMMGGQFRYLTSNSNGQMSARFLPDDKAYKRFLQDNQWQYPEYQDASPDRWSAQIYNVTQLNPDLRLRINFQQVSDDYYLQDFSSNLAILTERQLIREGDLTYTTSNWLFHGLLQSYQTLQPINETPISDIYQRLPQILALGSYDDLPFRSNLSIQGQFDNFDWPNTLNKMPEGPRYYLNPILTMPHIKPWGFVTPSFEVVQNHYEVHDYYGLRPLEFQRTIPRFSVDSGLFFEREIKILNEAYVQTLEPRIYYLNVPYRDQTPIPVYDSSYMIFNTDQLFRTNRFSGLDRIGDANQLSYAVTSRWIADESGDERASFSIGQIRYFSDRRVKLCQNPIGNCIDNPLVLGYLSPITESSPIASRAVYHINSSWVATGDYVWDVNTRATNNGHLDFHYQPAFNQLVGVGYTYMVIGDITQVANTVPDIDPLHQATFSYAWPFSEKWSSLGAFSYNISKRYEMMSLLGLQYDNCCWAVRLVGGRSFKSLSPEARPQYNNNVFLQVQLKGLGSVGNSDAATTIRTYVPGYVDTFRR